MPNDDFFLMVYVGWFSCLIVPGKPEKKEKKVDHHQAAKPAASKKKQEKWAPRDSKQAFSHPWMMTSLKGHTGEVLDMDFSGNSKFLATCADGKLNLTKSQFRCQVIYPI